VSAGREALLAKLRAQGIASQRVLDAIARVPRERFVPRALRGEAYLDEALPIGSGQSISQPYVVAYMTELLELRAGDRVLEIGTGSGYQCAVLAELAAEVYSIEILPKLADEARELLTTLGYQHLRLRCGDGSAGWPEEAPFERILITAAAPALPEGVIEQLAPAGRLVVPLDDPAGPAQHLWLLSKDDAGRVSKQRKLAVSFVPMEGAVRLNRN